MNNVVVLHPDLGLGGAERLIVDVSLAIQSSSKTVKVITSHYDSNRRFEDASRLNVDVRGSLFPRSFFGRFHFVCALIRFCIVTLFIPLNADVVVVDQIAHVVFLAKLLRAIRALCGYSSFSVVFYCHFPDSLLVVDSETSTWAKKLKQLYRLPIDYVEKKATEASDMVFVNSEFTRSVVASSFGERLAARCVVLYPCVSETLLGASERIRVNERVTFDDARVRTWMKEHKTRILLSMNRFERKKNLALAIEALHELKDPNYVLVLAGGYDVRVSENVEHLEELRAKARELGVDSRVAFVRSYTNDQRFELLRTAWCVLYTPSFEHFGIVPLEAMAARLPVIALNNGGPKESIVHEETGFLCKPNSPIDVSEAIRRISSDQVRSTMGRAGRMRVQDVFSPNAFRQKLMRALEDERTTNVAGEVGASSKFLVAAFALIGCILMFFIK